MTRLLIRLFIKDQEDTHSPGARGRYGLLASLVGIASNLLLFLGKLFAGLVSGSISILADAVNNLSDCASSLITLAGFRLSRIPADEQHPYGHARFEYISGVAVSCLIILIGLELLQSSFQKVLNPEPVEFSPLIAGILAASILIKLWQSRFNRRVGKAIGSDALIATSADSRNDVITTGAVLAAALVAEITGLHLDGWMGMGVAAFVLVSGVGMVRETVSPLLGAAPDEELVRRIQDKIMGYESVLGTHDLMVHNYGPGRCFASVHVEVPANQDIMVSHDIIDTIERDFAQDLDISLVIHLDPIVTDDERVNRMRAFVEEAARRIDPVLSVHDFRMVEGRSHTNLIFDVTAPPRYRMSDAELRACFEGEAKALEGAFYCVVTVDRSYTSTSNRLEP